MIKVYTQNEIPSLRDDFINAVKETFNGDSLSFLDIIENEEYNPMEYDVFYDYNDETYIINRLTGEYINWYKCNHLGRDIHTTIHDPSKDKFTKFLKEFKYSCPEAIGKYKAESEGKETVKMIPYLMHQEMGVPIMECQAAYDLAIEYLRNKARLKG